MTEFRDIRDKLQKARARKEKTGLELFLAREKLKKIKTEMVRHDRFFNPKNKQHQLHRNHLKGILAEAEERFQKAKDTFLNYENEENLKISEFTPYSDPEKHIKHLSDDYPFLLLPLRLETRFKKLEEGTFTKHQLWVRIFPDDCFIDTFEPVLSETEVENARSYWTEIWKAGGNDDQKRGAWRALVSSHGSGRAAWIVRNYKPLNILEKHKRGNEPVFPDSDDVEIKKDSWSQAAKSYIMPDRFILMMYRDREDVIKVTGNPVPFPLVLGPDPSPITDEQRKEEDEGADDIQISEEIKWIVDFDQAVEAGMGFRVDLDPEDFRKGFDRLIVLGLRLSSDENESQKLLEKLIHNHQFSSNGFALLPQGTPTNNTEDIKSGFSHVDDPDKSYKDFFEKDGLFKETNDWLKRQDGQWLADCLGINGDVLKQVTHSGGNDQSEAKAMNVSLWPATMGYFLETMMAPIFNEESVDAARWFFNNFVSGRGMVPAVRIGKQPYGILPTTAFSKMRWIHSDDFRAINGLSHPQGYHSFLGRLYEILKSIDWSKDIKEDVSYFGKKGMDPHRLLMDIIGLHSGSVELYSRFCESSESLFNSRMMQNHHLESLNPKYLEHHFTEGMKLLENMGYKGLKSPDILKKFFFFGNELIKEIIDDNPLSEKREIRNYTPEPNETNYIGWLIDAAETDLETVRLEEGFINDTPPDALLYKLLRHAIILGYWDSSIRLHQAAGLIPDESIGKVRMEPAFIHVRDTTELSESRWQYLYKKEPAITNDSNTLIVDHIPKILDHNFNTRYLHEQIKALQLLKNSSTASLERALTEHIDCCSYRLDSWMSGLIHYQLAAMRYREDESGEPAVSRGIYLGAYGWLEDVRPNERKKLTMFTPEEPLNDMVKEGAAIYKDSDNGGYIHAPSLNQAVTSAVLRNAYRSYEIQMNGNAAANDESDSFMINLSSKRVRSALSILEGIRNGQSLAALLGYRFERGLHDENPHLALDKYIYAFRKEFQLVADENIETNDSGPVESMEAQNVVHGLKLIEKARLNKGESGSKFPYGVKGLGSIDERIRTAIESEVGVLLKLHDAVADLAMAESVHQVVQGNYDRAAATLDAYSKANFPPQPDVVKTPRSGITLTHRVAVHLEPGLDPHESPYDNIPVTPRSQAEPDINRWLSNVLPPPENVACTVTYFDFRTNKQVVDTVTQQLLKLQPIDLIYMMNPESGQAMTELDDRVIHYINHEPSLRPDSEISIKYTDRIADKITFYELFPLIKSLRALILQSRSLRAGDILLQDEATSAVESSVFIRGERKDILDHLITDMEQLNNNVKAFLSDSESNKNRIIEGIDQYIDQLASIFSRAGLFNLTQSSFGFIYKRRQEIFIAIYRKVDDLVKRWQDRIEQFNTLISEYSRLPHSAAASEKFELLRIAESLISTDPSFQLPQTPDIYKSDLLLMKAKLEIKRDQFEAILLSSYKKIKHLLSDIEVLADSQIPVSKFDLTGLDLSGAKDQILLFAEDLSVHAKNLSSEMASRIKKTAGLVDEFNKTSLSEIKKVETFTQAWKILLGEDFHVIPEFSIMTEQGDEWEKAYNLRNNLLEHLTNALNTERTDFPVDDWLYGIARVREKMLHVENMIMLSEAFGKPDAINLHPMQLPYKANDSWLGLSFPKDYTIDSDRLLYTAHYADAFYKTRDQCGLLIDEWTEVIPAKRETTGIAFHYDTPSNEPPQVMLLATPPEFTGSWKWEDLVDALHDTLEMAKLRAVEPAQIDKTSYAAFLPAMMMAMTLHGISISGSPKVEKKND